MAEKATLVQQVKEWQRMSKGHKESWDRFVKKKDSSGTFDPNRHDVSLLQEFLTAAHAGEIEIPDVPNDSGGKGWGKGWGGGKGGWGGDSWGGGGWGGKGGGKWSDPWEMMGMMMQQMWGGKGGGGWGGNSGGGGWGDNSGNSGDPGRMPSDNGQEWKPGDWNCPSCGNLNFARRDVCKKCGTERPADAGGKDGGGKGNRYSPY